MLTQLHQQGGEEARLTVSRCEDVAVRDEDAATLVLGEQAQPGGLLDQHLKQQSRRLNCRTEELSTCQGQSPNADFSPPTILPWPRSGRTPQSDNNTTIIFL